MRSPDAFIRYGACSFKVRWLISPCVCARDLSWFKRRKIYSNRLRFGRVINLSSKVDLKYCHFINHRMATISKRWPSTRVAKYNRRLHVSLDYTPESVFGGYCPNSTDKIRDAPELHTSLSNTDSVIARNYGFTSDFKRPRVCKMLRQK